MRQIILLGVIFVFAPLVWAETSGALRQLAPTAVKQEAISLPKAVPGAAGANGPVKAWKRINLTAQDGTSIQIDYAPLDLGATVTADPMWVTVSNPKFDGSQAISVRLLSFYEAGSGSREQLKEAKELSLRYNGSAFIAEAAPLDIYEGHHSWSVYFRQEISVAVNGVRLTDPVNGTHNFRFKLSR